MSMCNYMNNEDNNDMDFDINMDIDNLCDDFNVVSFGENHNNDLIVYIRNLNIDNEIKNTIMNLIYNDNYDSYSNIYNICIENNIELPPL